MGDFNEVCYDSEKSWGLRKRWSAMSDFREALEDSKLEDMGFQGPKYTWSNKREGTGLIMERLDRGMCNEEWRTLFPFFSVRHLDFWGSDHRPILLEFSDSWDPGNGCGFRKARRCGVLLNNWNTKKRESHRKEIAHRRKELGLANRADIPKSWRVIRSLEEKLDQALEVEERYWCQRDKVEWMKSGDRNSGYFHAHASTRKGCNRLSGLFDDNGQWTESKKGLEEIICRYFSNLYESSSPNLERINAVLEGVHAKLSDQMARFLGMKFSEADVQKAVFDMSPIKAPGKDGLPAIFYQKYWGTIGMSVTDCCLDVLNNGGSVQGFNNTIITLIPKKHSPEVVSGYRPISLCNVLYKIIAKAITNRLRSVLDGVISESQSACLPGRLIYDNTVVGFECLHGIKRRRRKKGSMAIKLDMSKAYDRVEWIFVEKMMLKMGFPEQWVNLILRCISSVTYSFMLNGEVSGNIIPSRGLRQGNLISPYLFLICSEGLSCLIRNAQIQGKLTGFKCSKSGPVVSHLFFADDSLLFTEANNVNCLEVRHILDEYGSVSGQVVNYNKSAMCVSPSIPSCEGKRLADLVGVNLVVCHEKYLGLRCFTGRSKRQLFADIVDRVWGKLKGWGEKLLSVGGKDVLIKAVIQSIPTYAMSMFRLPKSLISEIHRLCARFWWGGSMEKRKMHWCKWRKLCTRKEEGGLGFKNLETFNRALLAKQGWRILKNLESLVARVLKGCYFSRGGFLDAAKKDSNSFVWKSIIWGKGILDAGMRWRVGNGSSIIIYNDRWIQRPSTFKIISSPKLGSNAKVERLISPSGGWDLQKINCNFDKEDVQEILSIPFGSGKTEDTMLWHYDERGLYTVKSGYCIGQELAGSPGVSNNLAAKKWWLGLWKLNIPLKVKIFIWKASHEWIPTRANLTKRGLQLDNKCPMCMTETETTIHALWSCRKLQYARKEWVPSGRVLINNYGQFFDFIYDCFRLLCAMDFEVLCVTVWKVWCARNSFLHDRKRHDVWNSMNWSRVFLGAFQQRGYVVPDKGVKNNLNEIQWQSPDQG
ncbi:hypothetical protein Dsin_015818 [Dipteronia sinensis]|uniref:Reverse transcriptase domain-containing protein n=1 Tax=Dipteronia sinensis TaxID=43782 RepID=A0AAE0AD64_9ROSI|nr:hypothetical protein Dsin_015818 [Dipteronia sinensis]